MIYLLDSIVKTNDGSEYRLMFGQRIANIVLHVYETASNEVRDNLCKVRQTWTKLFAVNVLNELDAKIRKLDSNWPLTYSQRKNVNIRNMMAEIKKVKSQIELMQKEIDLLEQKETVCESKKRCRTEAVELDEMSSKKRNLSIDKRKSSFDCDSEMKSLSSVFLTPSPEREECDSDVNNTFWFSMNNLEHRKSNSPILLDQNCYGELPFLNDSNVKNNATEMSCAEVSADMHNTNAEESIPQTVEEAATAEELEFIEPIVPFINLDQYIESPCMIPNVHIKTEPNPLVFDEDEDEYEEPSNDCSVQPTSSPEPYRKSPPLMLSIDGNIELEPLIPLPKTSKQIKINLTNSKLVAAAASAAVVVSGTEPRSGSPKTPDIPSEQEQSKRKMPSEWKTPLISFEVKESMRNATFHEQPICRKGWEQSGMCSIM